MLNFVLLLRGPQWQKRGPLKNKQVVLFILTELRQNNNSISFMTETSVHLLVGGGRYLCTSCVVGGINGDKHQLACYQCATPTDETPSHWLTNGRIPLPPKKKNFYATLKHGREHTSSKYRDGYIKHQQIQGALRAQPPLPPRFFFQNHTVCWQF